MTENEIFVRLVRILSKQLNIEEEKILPQSRLADELGADSLDTAEIAMQIQDEFAYDFKDDEIAKVKTVGDILDALTAEDMKKS